MRKPLSGDGAADMPASTVYPVTATWVDLLGETQTVELELTAGTPAVIEGPPLGTEVTLVEGDADTPQGVKWVKATWSSDEDAVSLSTDGTEATITVVADADSIATVTLDNEYEKVPELPVTGGVITAGVLGVAALLIAGGAILLIRRRQDA